MDNVFLSIGDSRPVKDHEIKKVIPQLYRTKNPSTGKEWLFYNVDLYGNDWKGNRKDFSYMEGGIPVFNYEIGPSTQKVIPQTTQVMEITKKYTIPFTKEKVDELSKYFRNPLSCIVVAADGRKYSVSPDQFKSLGYNKLIDMAARPSGMLTI